MQFRGAGERPSVHLFQIDRTVLFDTKKYLATSQGFYNIKLYKIQKGGNMSFNPTILAPIATVLASIAALAVPLYIGISQNKLQKQMHNRDCMLVRQEKLLEIYNVFASCLNKLNINAVLQKMKMG